ncbi:MULTISPECIES: ATP-binding protein [unclassified Nocardioides]|uniref:ATP-binding protein n=1 Tax=unclassified Nocardioides TaxID=2615069 RepID=UPI00360CCD36
MGGDVAKFHRLWLAASNPAGPSMQNPPRIAGRETELAAVRRHLHTGTGMLLVIGEAGVGKTRLVDTARATADVVVARGAGLPLSSEVPFLPVTGVLQALHRAAPLTDVITECPSYVRGTIGSLLPEVSIDEAPKGLETSARPRLFSAVHTVLEAAVARRRMAVLIDDLHWADSDTLDLLEHLLGAGINAPVLGTFRLDDPAIPDPVLAWAARVRRLPNVDTLDLPPLTRDETADQMRMLPAPHPRTDEEVDRIYARSRGLPLFTEQLAVDANGPMPRLLDDVLGQRVADLPAAEQQVASTLAVADRGLPIDVLLPVSGMAADALTPALRGLDRRRLLADGDDEAVALRHPLLAEAVRRRLVPGEATELHCKLALALAACGEPAEVAAHWQAAGDATEELGWRIRAARSAQERIAVEEEARQWRRALELWADGGDLDENAGLRRIDAEIALVDALLYSGQIELAWEVIQPVLDRVDELPTLVAAEVLYRAAGYETELVDGPVPVERAATAVALFETAPPGRSLVRALLQYANCLHLAGRAAEVRDVDRRRVAVCRSIDDPMELRRALTVQAIHLADRGSLSEIRELLDEAHRIVPSPPDPIGDTWLGGIETDLVLKFGGGTTALVAAGRDALAAADEWALDTYVAAAVRYNIALGWLRAGHLVEAAAMVDGRTQGPPTHDKTPLHEVRVALDAVRGRREEAAQRLSAVMSQIGAARLDPEFNAVVTECELWSGRAHDAYDRLSESLQSESGRVHAIMAGECQVLAVRAAADLAEEDPARRATLRRRVTDLLDRDDPTDVASQAQQAYRCARAAELSRLAGDPRVDLWASAAREWSRIGRPFDAAYCSWRGAQVALLTGQGSVALRLLRRAAREARDHVPLSAAIAETAARGHSSTAAR